MKRPFLLISALCALCIFPMAGCFGLFDSGIEWRGGPYVLTWIDDPNRVTLNYDSGKGSMPGRIEACVFAVGWDGRYLVAKQHPAGDKTITNFFIIDAQKDGPYADPGKIVVGPLSESEFIKKTQEMNLPPFSKKLDSLE